MSTENDKFKKGDVVSYRFEDFHGIGIIMLRPGTNLWSVMVEKELMDVRCFEDQIEKVNPPLNVFDLIREKQHE